MSDLSNEIAEFLSHRNNYTREERKIIHQEFLSRIGNDESIKKLGALMGY